MQNECLKDPQFLKIAHRLGYQRSDLQPINQHQIYLQSEQVTKLMSQIQTKYYIRKKIQALQVRQQGIFAKINEQYKINQVKGNPKKRNKIFNPIVTKLFYEHQNILEKNQRYQEKIRVMKNKNNTSEQRYRVRNTIDLGRTSPNFSDVSRMSQKSRKSMHSSSSARNSQISQTSHRRRLQLVRNKQRQIQHYKKTQYIQQQYQSKKKIDNVYHQRQVQSRKIKTRSEICRQAASQKKAQLNFIKNQQIRNHLQNMHYKRMRQEMLKQKQKQIQEQIKDKNTYNIAQKKYIKNMYDRNDKMRKTISYQSKMQAAERKKREVQALKRNKMLEKIEDRKYKQTHSQKYMQHKQKQLAQRGKLALFYEQRTLEQAEQKRNQYQSQKKIKLIQSRVKQQIVKKNLNYIERQKKIQTSQKMRQYADKINQIKEIQKLKTKLANQRLYYKKNSDNASKSRETSRNNSKNKSRNKKVHSFY